MAHINSYTIPGLQGQGDRGARHTSPQTGLNFVLPTSGRPCARGEESHAEGDRPKPPSPCATCYTQNTSKDQTRVMRPVQDAIGQMPPTHNCRSNTVWRDHHEPLLSPITTTTMPGIDYPVNHETFPMTARTPPV
jgi:hypothetical protein